MLILELIMILGNKLESFKYSGIPKTFLTPHPVPESITALSSEVVVEKHCHAGCLLPR
jgi:hypothetical protein